MGYLELSLKLRILLWCSKLNILESTIIADFFAQTVRHVRAFRAYIAIFKWAICTFILISIVLLFIALRAFVKDSFRTLIDLALGDLIRLVHILSLIVLILLRWYRMILRTLQIICILLVLRNSALLNLVLLFERLSLLLFQKLFLLFNLLEMIILVS